VNTTLDAHISRYEGMKSSGKLGIIKNTDLLNNIIDLQEVAIKNVQSLDAMYADYANRLGNFLFEHATLTPDSKIHNAQDVLRCIRPLPAPDPPDRPGTGRVTYLS
jgi:hypothetical protein